MKKNRQCIGYLNAYLMLILPFIMAKRPAELEVHYCLVDNPLGERSFRLVLIQSLHVRRLYKSW